MDAFLVWEPALDDVDLRDTWIARSRTTLTVRGMVRRAQGRQRYFHATRQAQADVLCIFLTIPYSASSSHKAEWSSFGPAIERPCSWLITRDREPSTYSAMCL